MPETAPYGSWPSPVTAEIVAENDGRPGWVSHDGDALWWTRPHPAEDGRVALLRLPAGADEPEVVLPAPWNVRTRVHEYGGLAYVVVPSDGAVVFAEFSDQRLYRFVPGSGADPAALTPAPPDPAGLRYAEPVLSPSGTEVWCVREEHTGPAPTDVRRALVAVPLDGSGDVRVLVEDTHFLACPRPSPDGARLAWIGWEHPDMPWDATVVRVAPVAADGSVGAPVTVAGGPDESIPQIEWETPDALLAATDRTGWWNLHRVRVDADGADPEPLCERAEEFAGPLWRLGERWFAPIGEGEVAVIRGRASARLNLLDTTTGLLYDLLEDVHTEWTPTLAVAGRTVYGVAASPVSPYGVVRASVGAVSPVTPSTLSVPVTSLPRPQPRTFAGPGGRDVHAVVYPPSGSRFGGAGAEKPPYVVFAHGGPTHRMPMAHDLEIAYFTSRGLGVVEVNYGGSTGFGRPYRDRLREQWGIVDVEDCVAAAKALVDEGFADGARLAIRGGSAGGWTSAAALAFTDVFACATIMYPVLDLVAFRTGETHDFESQYLEGLVGPWPETEERYRERSPINVPEKFTVPFLLLQGLEDEVCPPGPTARFAERVAELGVEHEYIAFEGEQHGFRRKETIVTALEKELALYARVFGFTASVTGRPSVVPLRRPRRLVEGDRVAVVAPSGPVPKDRLDAGCAILRSWGLDVVVMPHVLSVHPSFEYLAGTDDERAADLQEAWCSPDFAAVLCARGGYGVQRLASLLDWAAMAAATPKAFVGYSDITALHSAFARLLGVATVHGPMIAAEAFVTSPSTAEGLRSMLFGGAAGTVLTSPQARALVPGVASGVTVGGCLALLAGEIGTPTALPSAAGALVLLEDVGEKAYRLDGFLTHLLRSGWLSGVAGIALGSWHDCEPVEELLLDRLGGLGVPVVTDLGFGHGPSSITVPLGVPATLDAGAGTLTLDADALT